MYFFFIEVIFLGLILIVMDMKENCELMLSFDSLVMLGFVTYTL